jgi:hypothetical protein
VGPEQRVWVVMIAAHQPVDLLARDPCHGVRRLLVRSPVASQLMPMPARGGRDLTSAGRT